MKEKKIRRIIVTAILLITAIVIAFKLNIKPVERISTAIVEETDNTQDNGAEPDSDKSSEQDEDDKVDNQGEESSNGGDIDSGDADNHEKENTGNEDNGNNTNDNNDDVDEPDDNNDDSDDDPVNYITVYMTIDATLLADGEVLTANGHENKIQYTGDNGIIAGRVPVKIKEDGTVFEALNTFCKENGIHMEATGSSFNTAYVRAINHLYEFDGGISSGWVFLVNNVYATSGASNVHLKEGDEVWWFYTLQFGKDVPN